MTHLWRLRSAHDTNTNTIVLVVLSKSAALVPSHWFLCSSRNVSFVEELADADYAMVTYKCGLSAGTMSKDRRAKAAQKRSETIAANTSAAKAAAKSATSRANLAKHCGEYERRGEEEATAK